MHKGENPAGSVGPCRLIIPLGSPHCNHDSKNTWSCTTSTHTRAHETTVHINSQTTKRLYNIRVVRSRAPAPGAPPCAAPGRKMLEGAGSIPGHACSRRRRLGQHPRIRALRPRKVRARCCLLFVQLKKKTRMIHSSCHCPFSIRRLPCSSVSCQIPSAILRPAWSVVSS